ncbi:MAG: hypothetical protein Q9169_008706, partial [Polycauliona sp. 2 TL-2023]
MVQKFLHVATPTPTIAPSPFDKLPTELQQKIIREVLPDYSLHPRRPPKGVHVGRSNYWDRDLAEYWNEEEQESFRYYLSSLKQSDEEKEIRDPKAALKLLQVSTTFNTITRSIYDTEKPLVTNITWMCFHFLERIVNKNRVYPTYTNDLPRYPHFRQLHNFELNFNHDPEWWSSYLGLLQNPEWL